MPALLYVRKTSYSFSDIVSGSMMLRKIDLFKLKGDEEAEQAIIKRGAS